MSLRPGMQRSVRRPRIEPLVLMNPRDKASYALHCARPDGMDPRELVVAAGLAELLAQRVGDQPPAWTRSVGAHSDPVLLDPGIEMPRTLARAKRHAPDALRERNLFALPDFLEFR